MTNQAKTAGVLPLVASFDIECTGLDPMFSIGSRYAGWMY